MELEMVGF